MEAQFGLLGDVEVRVEGRPVDVGHARQRCVLVVLLIEANHTVSADELVDRVWADRPPHRARETLHSYLSRLRHTLDPLPGVDLTRHARGYVLTTDPMTVDLHRFGHLVTQARTAADDDQALALFEQALALWRGEPFAGLDTPWVNTQRTTLEQHRFAIQLDCTDLQLRRGHHGWLLGEITTRAQAHPLNERVAGQLMLALYHSGRQADAVEHYQQLRLRLAEDLGIDPSPGLQRRFEQILTTDPALTTPTALAAASVSAPPPVPRQLPAQTPHFVGRTAELRQLTTLLDDTTPSGGTVVITAIGGTAGIGKTALALHWAHQAACRFPDGQLYVNLRGFDPTNTPLHPTDALRGFLDTFEIPPARIPTSVDAQAGLYRSLLADRRVLIVLDNARDDEQVRPLLPASPTCLVLITSRNQLTSLAAHHGAHPLTLGVLTIDEARTLLARHLGPERISAEPDAVRELINHCAQLPLALAIVAARASTHPGFELRVLAKELADVHTRLDALDTGDPTTSIRAVLSWSYHHLNPAAARMFRLLGLHPGPDIALPAAAQLADLPPPQAREALGELTRAHLITQHTPGRYTFHDLLRAYATHLTTTHDTQHDQHTALTRLFDHYLHTATAAMNALHHPVPNHQHRPLGISAPAQPTPLLSDPATARHWLDTEQPNLTAIIAHTATHGWHTHTTQMANTMLLDYLEFGVHSLDPLALSPQARFAAPQTNNPATEALALSHLGVVHAQQGRYQQATDHLQHALALSRKTGFAFGEALALAYLGLVHSQQARCRQATDDLQQAVTLCHDIGVPFGEALALAYLGTVYWQQGRYPQATDHLQQALAICRDIGFPFGEALALAYLGSVHAQQGRYPQATDDLEQALTISRDIGFPVGETLALSFLGIVHTRQGRYRQATEHHQQALAISRDIGYPVGETLALSFLASVHARQGRYRQATEHHQQALAISRDIGFPVGEVLALSFLGIAHAQQGRYPQATDHLQHALAISRDIGFPVGEVLALSFLGIAHAQQGRYPQATDHLQHALAICREIGDRASEAPILNNLGETYYATGQLGEARTRHAAALTLAIELGDRYEQARAHHGLAHTHHTTGDLAQAGRHWHQSLTLYTDLDVPDAQVVRAHLTALDQTP